MRDSALGRPPVVLDGLGRLCHEGREIATYLFQVPDDEDQRQRLRDVVDVILQQPEVRHRVEFPRIAEEVRQALSAPPSARTAEFFQDAFDRMLKLWQAARSGIF